MRSFYRIALAVLIGISGLLRPATAPVTVLAVPRIRVSSRWLGWAHTASIEVRGHRNSRRPEWEEGTGMNAPDDNTALIRLRRWWASPARSGARRIISPWEYRHLRFVAGLRIGGGIALAGLAVVTLAFGGDDAKTYGWALVFLLPGLANLVFAAWELTIARSVADSATQA